MTAFVIIAAALVGIALLWILPPLLRQGDASVGVAPANLNLALLREQLAELEADLASGTLSAEQHVQAKRELERRVLEETAAAGPAVAVAPAGSRWTALALAVVVPGIAALLYYLLGNPAALMQGGTVADAGRTHELTPQQIEEMTAKLAARLAGNPGDAEGWAVLARSYASMRRFPEAIGAFEKAAALITDDANLLADYADVLAASANRSFDGKPLELVMQALKLQPDHWKALWMAGTAAFNRKDYREALRYWERLQAVAPPESGVGQSIAGSVAEARELGGIKAPSAPAAKTAIAKAPEAQAPPVAATPAADGAVQGTITLSPALAAKVAPEDALFVFARPAEGSKMPLAIFRSQVKELPLKFKLDDSMAMTPNMKISGLPQIVVGARISKTGNAMPQSGDLQGFSKPVKAGVSSVAVVIDSTIP